MELKNKEQLKTEILQHAPVGDHLMPSAQRA